MATPNNPEHVAYLKAWNVWNKAYNAKKSCGHGVFVVQCPVCLAHEEAVNKIVLPPRPDLAYPLPQSLRDEAGLDPL